MNVKTNQFLLEKLDNVVTLELLESETIHYKFCLKSYFISLL